MEDGSFTVQQVTCAAISCQLRSALSGLAVPLNTCALSLSYHTVDSHLSHQDTVVVYKTV